MNDFSLFKKKGDAGIMVYLRTLRALYEEAQSRDSFDVKKGNPFLKLIKTILLLLELNSSLSILKILRNYTPKESTNNINVFKMQRVIAVFLFQFAIGGYDFTDVANLHWRNIKSGHLKLLKITVLKIMSVFLGLFLNLMR
ncbi:MAG: hypothetical protein JKY73_04585 [Lutibacter sp.]|nr:hypothetical protein [Lutibacter sp.]